MNTLLNKLILLCGVLIFITIGCGEDPLFGDGADADLEARKCTGGKLCGKGAVCNEHTCGCPEGTYYIGNGSYWDPKYHKTIEWGTETDSSCMKISKNQYVLTYTEGPSEVFEYWPIAQRVIGEQDSFPYKLRINFYPETSPLQGNRISGNATPYYLEFYNNREDNNLPIDFFKEKSAMPFPLSYDGKTVPGVWHAAAEWNLSYSLDSLVLNVDFYNLYKPDVYVDSMKLVYERVGS